MKLAFFVWIALIGLTGAELLVQADANTSARSASEVCAQSHLGSTRDLDPGTTIQICDQFYDQAPLVRLPGNDNLSNPNQISFYGAIDSLYPAQSILSDRTGQKWLVLNSQGALNPVYDYSAFPTTMHMPSNMYLYLIYHFHGKIAALPSSIPNTNPPMRGVILSDATPAIYVPGSLMDNYMLGSWEGLVNLRLDPPPPSSSFTFFNVNSQAAIRIRFSALQVLAKPLASQVLSVWPDANHRGQKFQDVSISAAEGVVENFQNDVLASNGRCIKSLAGLNASNPFLGATSNGLTIYRYPSMHGAGSEAVVMTFPAGTENLAPTGMSVPFFMKASTLIASQPQFVINELPHSLHNGFELSGLHKVESGGGPCP